MVSSRYYSMVCQPNLLHCTVNSIGPRVVAAYKTRGAHLAMSQRLHLLHDSCLAPARKSLLGAQLLVKVDMLVERLYRFGLAAVITCCQAVLRIIKHWKGPPAYPSEFMHTSCAASTAGPTN